MKSNTFQLINNFESLNNKIDNTSNNANTHQELLLVSLCETGSNANQRPRLYEEVSTDRIKSEVDGNNNDCDSKERDQWSNKLEYMLSVIGYVVDLGSSCQILILKQKAASFCVGLQFNRII